MCVCVQATVKNSYEEIDALTKALEDMQVQRRAPLAPTIRALLLLSWEPLMAPVRVAPS